MLDFFFRCSSQNYFLSRSAFGIDQISWYTTVAQRIWRAYLACIQNHTPKDVFWLLQTQCSDKVRPRRKHHNKTTKFTCSDIDRSLPTVSPIGGALPKNIEYLDVAPYITESPALTKAASKTTLRYVTTVRKQLIDKYSISTKGFVHAQMPLDTLHSMIAKTPVIKAARLHGLKIGNSVPTENLETLLSSHVCKCREIYDIFVIAESHLSRKLVKTSTLLEGNTPKPLPHASCSSQYWSEHQAPSNKSFPPEKQTQLSVEKMVESWCNDASTTKLEEAGCAVCGQLSRMHELTPLSAMKNFLQPLECQGVTRIEKSMESQPILEKSGPVLAENCSFVCNTCRAPLRNGKVPRLALANGLWIGEVPQVLQELNFVEKILVQKIRQKCNYVKVATGMQKMVSHVVAFESPVLRVYEELPPPKADMDEVLAIMFSGPTPPTDAEYRRLPLLVRRNKVSRALHWLVLNHSAYTNISISYKNLEEYPEDKPPVFVGYMKSESNRTSEELSVFDTGEDIGVQSGECPFVVHGLTGDSFETQTSQKLKAEALRHLNSNGKFLVVGHESKLQSIYNNPTLYSSMFPWLFPYGLGGLGSNHISDKAHKKFLLMYHDKRFQTDVSFPFVAFSHEQIKAATSSGFLVAETKKFPSIVNRLLTIDQKALQDIIHRLGKGEYVKPTTDQEKACYQLVNDLDHVAGRVQGSSTSKKYMRNEIWALTSYLGAPTWYITFAPSDTTHPLCIYWAGKDTSFRPTILGADERTRRVISNPVAGARFFHFMVEMFVKHILGVGGDFEGLYGDTAGYYGTVEQQGRLTLHLHLLLWIKGSGTPQEICDKLMDPDGHFQKAMVEYLESVHCGEFQTGTKADVEAAQSEELKESYRDPLLTLPRSPSTSCTSKCGKCDMCKEHQLWLEHYKATIDEVLLRVNIHRCQTTKTKEGKQMKNRAYKGCLDNKHHVCRARFPRETRDTTNVDASDGSLRMKHKEPWMNTITPALSYLLRCNHDVTSLLSGTAVCQQVVSYLSSQCAVALQQFSQYV